MKKNLVSMIFLLFCASFVWCVDWPVENPDLLSSFGSNEGDHFLAGIKLTGGIKKVQSADQGELVYYWNESRQGNTLPSGLGNMVILEHQDGLKTLYAHLSESDISTLLDDEGTYISEGAKLGSIGDSGWTYGNQLFFAVFDSEFNQFVNPLLILPSLMDNAAPQIRNTALQYGDSEITVRDDIIIPAGDYRIVAEIFDYAEKAGVWNLRAPYTVQVYVNGREASEIIFEALQESNGTVILQRSDNLDHAAMYADGRKMVLGSLILKPGITGLEIIIRDYAGNEASQLFQFEVVD